MKYHYSEGWDFPDCLFPQAAKQICVPGKVIQVVFCRFINEILRCSLNHIWISHGHYFPSLPRPCGSGSSLSVYHHWVCSRVMPGLVSEASWSFRSSFHSFLWICSPLWGPGHCVWWFKKVNWCEQVLNDGSIRRRRPRCPGLRWLIDWQEGSWRIGWWPSKNTLAGVGRF